MDRETKAALKEKWPPKEGRSVDPAATRIDHIVLCTQGHEYKPCGECKGRGVVDKDGKPFPADVAVGPDVVTKSCGKCKGSGRVPTHDTLQEVSFGVAESYITRGNRLILICTAEQASKVDRVRIRELET